MKKERKVIDAHLHIFGHCEFGDRLAHGIGDEPTQEYLTEKYYGRLGIEKGIVMGNGPLEEQGKNLGEYFYYSAGLDEKDSWLKLEEIESHLQRKRCVGVKLYPGYYELYPNDKKVGLSRDCPKDELFTWIMEITEKKRQINQFLKAPRRAIDKASQHLKGRAESFFGDEYKMDQFQVEDLEAEIERLETNVLENSTSGLVDEAKFKEQIETVDKKVKKDIVSHIRRSTAVQVGCCLLLVYLLGFVPYWISAAKLGGSQFGSAVVVALAALAVAAAGGIAALFILRYRVRMSMEEYNHVIHTMVNNVNASADEFGKYFTAVCTYMKAQSIRAGIKLKSESISSAQFILRAHKQALKSSIERDEEVAASYGIRRVAEVEKNITSFFHEEKLPKDNALYYYETDKSDVGIPLNEAGDLVRAPYKFVAKLKLEREDLYDEVKGEV